MGGGHHVGAGRVDLGVDGEGGPVDRHVPLDHLALVVDQDEVGDPDVTEVHAEGIDPEVVEALGVAGGDVPGHPLVEAELGEEPEPGGQALLAVEPLLLGRVERHVGWELHDLGHRFLLLSPRGSRHWLPGGRTLPPILGGGTSDRWPGTGGGVGWNRTTERRSEALPAVGKQSPAWS